MTATGSHVHFYSLRGAQPPGEGYFSVPAVPTPIFTALTLPPSGRGMPRPYSAMPGHFTAPTVPHRGICAFPQKITIGHGKNPVADGFKKKEVNYETP